MAYDDRPPAWFRYGLIVLSILVALYTSCLGAARAQEAPGCGPESIPTEAVTSTFYSFSDGLGLDLVVIQAEGLADGKTVCRVVGKSVWKGVWRDNVTWTCFTTLEETP